MKKLLISLFLLTSCSNNNNHKNFFGGCIEGYSSRFPIVMDNNCYKNETFQPARCPWKLIKKGCYPPHNKK